MVDYTQDKFRTGDHIKFDIKGTDLQGTGEILGRATDKFVIAPMWIVMLDKKLVHMNEEREEKAIIVQEVFITKEETNMDGKYRVTMEFTYEELEKGLYGSTQDVFHIFDKVIEEAKKQGFKE